MRFTERELDIMAVLWERGEATVAEVRDALDDPLAYTTVLSVLQVLEEKGHVGHRGTGRAYTYYARVEQLAAGRSALSRLKAKLFGGSIELLMTQMVNDRDLTPAQLRRLRQLMDERLGKGKK